MRVYELTFILNPNLDKETVNSELDKLTDMVKKAEGTLYEVQHLGMRRLTFEMAGHVQGNYYTIYFSADPKVLTEIDKYMKLSEAYLRSMTIVLKQSIYEATRKKKSEDERSSVSTYKKAASVYSNSNYQEKSPKEVSDNNLDDNQKGNKEESADNDADKDQKEEA